MLQAVAGDHSSCGLPIIVISGHSMKPRSWENAGAPHSFGAESPTADGAFSHSCPWGSARTESPVPDGSLGPGCATQTAGTETPSETPDEVLGPGSTTYSARTKSLQPGLISSSPYTTNKV